MRLIILAITAAFLATAATSSMAATSRKSSASGRYASVRSHESCEELATSGGFTRYARVPHTRRWTMKAIVVTDQAAGTAGMKLVERPEPPAAINDVIVRIHASGFVPTELAWPSTW